MKFFNPFVGVRQTANRLRHWQQEGAVYFVTFRLADSIPGHLRANWEEVRRTWLTFHPQPWSTEVESEFHRRFSVKMDQWLDNGYGSCVLRSQRCSTVVERALRHFDGERYLLLASVVMPNHVHALFVQHARHPLEEVLRSWKTFSSRQVNHLRGRAGVLWQRDYFDRLIRDERHLSHCIRYIRMNPEKARLTSDAYRLYESEFVRRSE